VDNSLLIVFARRPAYNSLPCFSRQVHQLAMFNYINLVTEAKHAAFSALLGHTLVRNSVHAGLFIEIARAPKPLHMLCN
jgi:hypothetical protein